MFVPDRRHADEWHVGPRAAGSRVASPLAAPCRSRVGVYHLYFYELFRLVELFVQRKCDKESMSQYFLLLAYFRDLHIMLDPVVLEPSA